MTNTPHIPNNDENTPPRDELDALLRAWHAANAEQAAAGRDRLMAALAHEEGTPDADVLHRIEPKPETPRFRRPLEAIRRIAMNKYSSLAAAAVLLAVMLPFVLPPKYGVGTSNAQSNIVMAPDGGRLDAFDKAGNPLGPCVLRHTDVKAEISGRFTRCTVTQQYHNPNPDKIEAVYTFPLSDRAGIDRMTMTIGDRVIVGEVKERQQARRIYEQAKAGNRVASLLEQERPNIFTQSIANIEPGATINIEISYVEMVAEHDGEFSFAFPTVVSPRYIPGASPDYRRERVQPPAESAGVPPRRGLILLAPARITVTKNGPGISRSDKGLDERLLGGAIASAMPTLPPSDAQTEIDFFVIQAEYPDGSKDNGIYRRDGFGHVGGRWFFCPGPHSPSPAPTTPPGDSFAAPTTQVPDADRITPMPTRPGVRAGHDISISVLMDTGGPGITFLDSPQHKVSRTDLAKNALDQPRRVSLALANLSEIPNRDFVLRWKQTSDTISSRMFTHTGGTGNFFCVQLDPPARVQDIRAVPRELVFVVDTSGSMNGRPITLCQEVMRKAIDQMRPQDTFNIITFAGATNIMWDRPRPNTTANRDEAQRFVASWQGAGGTEMMTAIEAALRQGPVAGMSDVLTPAQLADLPADGRQVAVEADDGVFRSEGLTTNATTDRAELFLRDDLSIKCSPFKLPEAYLKRAAQTLRDESITLKLLMRGVWITKNGERIFEVSSAEMSSDSSVRPLRIVMFLTDAEVGNDMAIIEAIKRNRSTTRVFSFGIGSSVNRYLIEQMALAGGGEPEYIYANQASEEQAAAAVERFNRRTRTPVLTDINVTFNGVQPLDVLPDLTAIQDLYDNRPLTFLGRYNGSGAGSITIKGQSAQGRWEKTIPIDFPAKQPENSSLPTLWARAKIDDLTGQDLLGVQRGQPSPDVRARIITLGETFNVMSQYTSFVAVDKLRVTVDSKPRLVHVPIELPDQTNWAGFFGEMPALNDDARPRLKDRTEENGRSVRRLSLRTEVLDKLVASNDALLKLAAESEKLSKDDDQLSSRLARHPQRTRAGDPPRPQDSSVPPLSTPPVAPAGGASPRPLPTVGAAPSTPAPASLPQTRAGSARAHPSATGAPTAALPGISYEAQAPSKPSTSPNGTYSTSLFGDASVAQVPAIDLYDVLRANMHGGGGQSPFSNSTFMPMRGDLPPTDPLIDADGRPNETSTLWLWRSQPSMMSNLIHNGPIAPVDVRDYTSALAGTGVTTINANGLSSLMVLGHDVTRFDPIEFLTLAAAQLAESGQVEKARQLVCSAFNGSAGAAQLPTDRLCEVLGGTLTESERAAAIREIGDLASAQIQDRLRTETLVRKLAPDVLIHTPTAERTRALRDAAAQAQAESKIDPATTKSPPPAAKPTPPKHLLVTILLADTSDETLDALKALGLKIESVRAEASVVVARVPIEKLEILSLLDVVKRVELVPMDETVAR